MKYERDHQRLAPWIVAKLGVELCGMAMTASTGTSIFVNFCSQNCDRSEDWKWWRWSEVVMAPMSLFTFLRSLSRRETLAANSFMNCFCPRLDVSAKSPNNSEHQACRATSCRLSRRRAHTRKRRQGRPILQSCRGREFQWNLTPPPTIGCSTNTDLCRCRLLITASTSSPRQPAEQFSAVGVGLLDAPNPR